MARKLSYAELRKMLADPEIPEKQLRPYLTIAPTGGGPFNPAVVPDPETVAISQAEVEMESALGFGNSICRWRRQRRFHWRIDNNDTAPVLVSEGDSWFEFPFLIDDVIDHLGARNYNIWSLGAAGDTAGNMVFVDPEYMSGLDRQAGRVKAFLLSAAGNDIIGAGPDGQPVLSHLVHQCRGGETAEQLVDRAELNRRLDTLRRAYGQVVETIRADRRFRTLPIIFHGYDYAIPGAVDDPRDPIYAAADEWLGAPLRGRNVANPALQRAIIRLLIDALYDLLNEFTEMNDVHVVDVRGTLPNASDWNDEIHGTDAGFARVAARFHQVLQQAIGAGGGSEFARARQRASVQPGTAEIAREPTGAAVLPSATIVIDPGHGGTRNSGGSSANNASGPGGALEKEKTLELGLRVADMLDTRGHRVLCTRRSDRNPGLAQRAAVARNAEADAFVSIHFNGWPSPSVQGTETYYHRHGGFASRSLAECVQKAACAATGLRDRGVKQAGFGVLRPDRHAPRCAACLLEASFLTDPAEEARLGKEDYLERVAAAIANGIEAYLRETRTLRADSGDAVTEGAFEHAAPEGEADLEDAASLASGAAREQAGAPPALARPRPDLAEARQTAALAGIADPGQFLRGWRDLRRNISGLTPTALLERTIGRDDSLPFMFLELGACRGRAVCKIEASGVDYAGRPGVWSGTGFLVGPDLLLTNHHVLNSPEVAREAMAIFGYARDHDGAWRPRATYRLEPERLFVTSAAEGGLDYTFVQIGGAPQDRFGWVPMMRSAFSVAREERANIIHHPLGAPKRVSLQDNKVVNFDEVVLHYASDTEGGSSGSPVMDNSWRLVALHHAARPLGLGEQPAEGGAPAFVNEGIRISAIAIDLEARLQVAGKVEAARRVLSHIEGADSLTGYFGAAGRRPPQVANALERVVATYRSTAQDVDIGFWNVEWFNRRYHERVDDVARVIADVNLDIWALEETSPGATAALVERLAQKFGHKLEFAASEPEAAEGRQTTAVLWNPLTVAGTRLAWPEAIDKVIRADSREVDTSLFEAVEGKIFNRYPGLFRFSVLGRGEGQAPFDFNLVPLHLKAMAEGAKRRRLASQVLVWAIGRMIAEHGADQDWLLGGDVNAELASGDFKPLKAAGFAAMSAADEGRGAFSYLESPRSLIDSIFLSPSLSKTFGPSDFFIHARDRGTPDYIDAISDHRPIMARLSLADLAPPPVPPILPPGKDENAVPPKPADAEVLKDADLISVVERLFREDPVSVLRALLREYEERE